LLDLREEAAPKKSGQGRNFPFRIYPGFCLSKKYSGTNYAGAIGSLPAAGKIQEQFHPHREYV